MGALAKTTTSNFELDELDAGQVVVARPELDREHVARFFFRAGLLTHLLVTFVSVGMWSPVLVAWLLGLGQWYSARRAEELDVRLLNGRLLIKDGVFTKTRKTIPLDKITDVGLQQGILERRFGLWRLTIQTASAGQPTAEGQLYGVTDPKGFRAEVLAQRERWLDGEDVDRRAPQALAPAGGRAPARLSAPIGGDGLVSRGELDSAVERLDRIESLLAEIAINTRRG
ncbi:MAG: PH domain-containing protein [Nannocystaceae bacterium]